MSQSHEGRAKSELVEFCRGIFDSGQSSGVELLKEIGEGIVDVITNAGDFAQIRRACLIRKGAELTKMYVTLPELLKVLCSGSTPEVQLRNRISATAHIFTHVAQGALPEDLFPRPFRPAPPPSSSKVSTTMPAVLQGRMQTSAPPLLS